MNYLVRTATVQDIAAIIVLERGSPTAAHWTEQQYENLVAGDPSSPARLVLVASREGDGAILGFLVARHVAREWELENIIVGGENRGSGVGTSLVRELFSCAQTSDGNAVFLEVRESNTAARAFYAKLGFAECGTRKGYYTAPSENAILYSKTLQKGPMSV